MGKKLLLEDIKEMVPKIAKGYKYIKGEYINSKSMLIFECVNMHEWSTTWSNFQQGHRCPKCTRHKRRLSIKDIRKEALKLAPDYKLLNIIHDGKQWKLWFECPKEHKWTVDWSHFKSGRRCKKCATLKTHQKQKLAIKIVHTRLRKLVPNYKWINGKYVNSHSKLTFKCDRGHIFQLSLDNIMHETRCKECVKIKSFGEVKKLFEAKGFELLETYYINNYTKMWVKCRNKHKFQITLGSFKQSKGCKKCSVEKQKMSFEDIKQYTKKEGYLCLATNYTNNYTKMPFHCPKCNQIFLQTWAGFKVGHRHEQCSAIERGISRRLSIENIRKEVNKIAPGYIVLKQTKYKTTQDKIIFKCPNCSYIFSMKWGNFKHLNQRCPECARKNKMIHDEESLKNFKKYRIVVSRYTKENYQNFYTSINPNKLQRSINKYHLDHIYTVIDGFNNGILPQIVANPTNLQMLSAFDNYSKNGRSDMTKEELFELYKIFIEENPTYLQEETPMTTTQNSQGKCPLK